MLGTLDALELNEELDRIWVDRAQRAQTSERIRELGMDPAGFWEFPRQTLFPLFPREARADEREPAVVVFFAPALNPILAQVAKTVWDELLLPRLRDQLGLQCLPGPQGTAPPTGS